jgi:RHS repeat-associated protein
MGVAEKLGVRVPYRRSSMFISPPQRFFSGLALASAAGLLVAGLSFSSASATEPVPEEATFNTALEAEVTAAAEAAVWTPPEATKPAPADSDVVEEEWEVPAADRVLREEGTAGRAPVGTTAGAPGLGALPYFGFEEFSLADDTVARVNLANGNLLITANDGSVAAPGVGVSADRFYNGLSTSDGVLGGGWSSTMSYADFGLTVNSGETSATFYGPSGFQATFTKSGAAWVAPSGLNATLTKGTEWVLKYNKTGETFRFNLGTKRISAHTDRNGVGTTSNWAASSSTYTVTDAVGRVTTANRTAGASPKITSIVDSAGRTTTYTRNSSQQLTGVAKPGGATTAMSYDSTGRLATLTVPSAPGTTVITFGYDSSHRITSLTQQSSSPTWGAKPDVVTTFTYNSGQTVVTNPNGAASTYAYDAQGRVTSATDALGRARAQTWTANSDIQSTTDALGSGSLPGNQTTNEYDALNNATKTELPTGAAASAVYATGADCSSAGGDSFQVKCTTDASGNTASYDYDAAGNVTTEKDTTPGGTGAISQRFTYDTAARSVCGGFAGQVCTSTDGNGNITTYAYDTAGNLTTVTPPAPQGATTYTYDSLSRVTSVTDGNGDTTEYGYDLRDRMVLTTFDGDTTFATTYYPNGLAQYQSDSFTGTKQFEYDTRGNVTQQIGALSGLLNKYTYDRAGNLLTFQNNGTVTTNIYNSANELTFQREPGGTCPVSGNPAAGSGCTVFFYDGNGAEIRRVFPAGAQVVTTRDNSGRSTRIQAKNAAGTVTADVGYSYGVGTTDTTLIRTRTSYREQGVTAGAVTTYSYDSLDRLTKAEEKTGATVSASWSYGYDAAGNRTTHTKVGSTGSAAGTTTYAYDSANRLTSTSADTGAWTFDAAGNQTRNGITGTATAYGDRGQVQTIGSRNYTQFGQGNTEQLTATGGRSFATSLLGLSSQNTGAAVQSFGRTPDGQAVSYRVTASHYYVYDAAGSVIGMFSQTGIYEGGYSYAPYGEARATGTDTAVTANQLRYIGGYQESANIYKLGARYYDATIGRFTQMDPSGQDSHPFAYAGGDPINFKDPTGLEPTLGEIYDVMWSTYSQAHCEAMATMRENATLVVGSATLGAGIASAAGALPAPFTLTAGGLTVSADLSRRYSDVYC